MSYAYNHIVLVGRLCHDPDFVESANYTRLKFKLAVNRYHKKKSLKKLTDFVPVVLWGTLSMVAKDYLKKGSPVLVEGRLRVSRYEREGKIKYSTEVHGTGFQCLGYDNLDGGKLHSSLDNPFMKKIRKISEQGEDGQISEDVFIELNHDDLDDENGDDEIEEKASVKKDEKEKRSKKDEK